jgi:hypothetical protein
MGERERDSQFNKKAKEYQAYFKVINYSNQERAI